MLRAEQNEYHGQQECKIDQASNLWTAHWCVHSATRPARGMRRKPLSEILNLRLPSQLNVHMVATCCRFDPRLRSRKSRPKEPKGGGTEFSPHSFPVHDGNGRLGGQEPAANSATSLAQCCDMPITTLKTAFGPEDTAAMTAAFEDTLTRLNVTDREAHIATLVAKKIVRLAKRGERNPKRLTQGVIRSFRDNPNPGIL